MATEGGKGRRAVKFVACGIAMLGAGPIVTMPASASKRPAAHHARHVPRHRSGGIPQHNGGDRDADNNGGPSDGDGNL